MKRLRLAGTVHGVLFVALFACAALYISSLHVIQALSLSPLIVGIILGMIYANTLRGMMPKVWGSGLVFCTKRVLRLGIILYGFRLTYQHIVMIGLPAVAVDTIIVCGTILLGCLIGRLLKLDWQLALLTSMGSAICGAAAVLGAEPVVKAEPYKTAVAVSTVVIFGTISMFLYPLFYSSGLFGLSPEQWALYVGSSVHEVAHVVGAGNAMGAEIADGATITKMIRVMMLAPVLLILSIVLSRRNRKQEELATNASQAGKTGHVNKSASTASKIVIPWFAVGFMLVVGFNSFHLLPTGLVNTINDLDTFMLTMAMTALGMETNVKKFKQAGSKPFALAFLLFLWLCVGGYVLSRYVPQLFA